MITFCIALLLLVAGYFVYGALVEKQLRNNGLPVPLGRDDTVGGMFCHRRLLSLGAKEGFPVVRKIPLG